VVVIHNTTTPLINHMTKRTSLILITSATALFVAACAAVFSVTGIAKLFAGAALSTAIMASALELGKLVSISFLYQYWERIPITLKMYLSASAFVLMLITSAGIYGYLTAAYAETAAVPMAISAEIQSTDTRIRSIQEEISRGDTRLNQLFDLRAQQENRLDSMVVRSQTGNTTTIRNAQTALSNADRSVREQQSELAKLAELRDSLTVIGIQKKLEIDTNAEIGTFLYIANMLGVPLDSVVKWFTLIIVLVFDPLAIALVISVNFLLKAPIQSHSRVEVNKKLTRDYPETLGENNVVDIQSGVESSVDFQLEQLMRKEEDTEVLKKYMDLTERGVPAWMEPEFDWDDTHLWVNNPIAKLYKQEVVDKHK